MEARVVSLTRKRNLDGSPINPESNSFGSLSNKDLMPRASKCGVIITDHDFTFVDIPREHGKSRMCIETNLHVDDVATLHIFDEKGEDTPINIEWMQNTTIDEESFTSVR